MSVSLKLDFVSDISCPWCAIALTTLETALARLAPAIEAQLRFLPFELNPDIGRDGQTIEAHLREKYGSQSEEIQRAQQAIRARGAEVGFTFDLNRRTRIFNTFDAHRLVHWAGLQDRQRALQHALMAAYFTEGRDPSDPEVLIELAIRSGLERERAQEILSSDEYANEVRAEERFYQERGIQAVPSIIINDQFLIQGGQPAQVFEELLRRIAAAGSAPAAS